MLGLDRYADFAADDPAPVVASLKRQADAILREIGPNKGQSDIRKLGWSFNHIESSTLLEPMMRLYNRTQDPRYLAFAKYIIAMGGTDGRWDIFRHARGGRARRQPLRGDARFDRPVRVTADAEGVVSAVRVPREDGRLAFRVPTADGDITLFDYASVDCWQGGRVCTWLPVKP